MIRTIAVAVTSAVAVLALGAGPAVADEPAPSPGCEKGACTIPAEQLPCDYSQVGILTQQVEMLEFSLRSEHRDLRAADHRVSVLERRIAAKDRLIKRLRAGA